MNPSSPAIDIEGYLFKFEELPNRNITWIRKWAILCDFCLYLYSNHGDKECKFAVVLPGARLSIHSITDGGGFQKDALFIEERNGIHVELGAENENEFQRWYDHLSAAVMLRKVENRNDPQYLVSHHGSFHRIETFAGQSDLNLVPSHGLPYDGPGQGPQYLHETLVSGPVMTADRASASDQISDDDKLLYTFSGPVRTSQPLPQFSHQGSVELNNSLRRPQSRLSTDLPDGLAASLGFPVHSLPNQGFQQFPENARDDPDFQRFPDSRRDDQSFQRFPDSRRDDYDFQRFPDGRRDDQSFQRFPDNLQGDHGFHSFPEGLQAEQGFQNLSDTLPFDQGVSETMHRPTLTAGLAMEPQIEVNGHYRQSYHSSIENDQRFQSFQELNTMERRRARVGEFANTSVSPSLQLDPQRFQSFPDLILGDRQERLRELKRPSGQMRGSSLTQLVMETVKEDPGMPESDILATLPLSEIRKRYPVSGLAKRMSIAASDLLGKSHDELVISLIQLHREKANLETIRDYCVQVLENINNGIEVVDETQDGILPENIDERKVRLREEIDDANQQLDISMPLISFIDNIVKMGSLFAGNDVMFATEYRKHLLSPDQYCPPSASLTFLRGVQEKNVASTLSRRPQHAVSSDGQESSTYDRLQDGITGLPESEESQDFVKSRDQLETELSELENIVVHYHVKKAQVTEFMKGQGDVKQEPVLGTIAEEEGQESPNGTLRKSIRRGQSFSSDDQGDGEKLHLPRRSSSRLLRSDITMSLRRQQSARPQYKTLSPNLMMRLQRGAPTLSRSRTLPSNFRSYDWKNLSGSQEVYERAESRISSQSAALNSNPFPRTRYASLPTRYAINEDKLAADFGSQLQLREARAIPASDSRLDQLTGASGRVNPQQPMSAMKSYSENPNLTIEAEHIYQNEPLTDAQSTPSLFRAEFLESTDSHNHTWTTVYNRDTSHAPVSINLANSGEYHMDRTPQNDLLFSKPPEGNSALEYERPGVVRVSGLEYGRPGDVRDSGLECGRPGDMRDSGLEYGRSEDIRDSGLEYGRPGDMRDSGLEYGRPGDVRDSGLEYGRPGDVRDSGLEYGRPGDMRDSGLEYGRPGDMRDSVLEYGRSGDMRDSGLEYGRSGDVRDSGLEYGRPGDMRDSGLEYGRPGDMRNSGLEYGRPGDMRDSGLEYGRSGDVRDSGLEYGRPGDMRDSGLEYGRPGDMRDSGLEYGRPGDMRDSGLVYGRNGTPPLQNIRTLDPLSQSSGMVAYQSSMQRNSGFSKPQAGGMITFQAGYQRDEKMGGLISTTSFDSNTALYYQTHSNDERNYVEHEVTRSQYQASHQWSSLQVETNVGGHGAS